MQQGVLSSKRQEHEQEKGRLITEFWIYFKTHHTFVWLHCKRWLQVLTGKRERIWLARFLKSSQPQSRFLNRRRDHPDSDTLSPPSKPFLVRFIIWRSNGYRYLSLMAVCENPATGCNYTSCCVKLNLQTIWFVVNWPLLNTNSRGQRDDFTSLWAPKYFMAPL